MLQYERIDISEGIDFNKSNMSVECMICHYWYFKDIGFKYQPYVCNGCHELILETFILISMVNGTESHGKNLMN